MTIVLIKREDLDTATYIGRILCKDKGSYQGVAAKPKECQRLPEATRAWGEACNIFIPHSPQKKKVPLTH